MKFDKLQRITDVININMNDNQWTQATLPVKDGGLGIRRMTVLTPSAFLASLEAHYESRTTSYL